jgi:glycosyltransferase involved in cell wall biosynthesis
MKLLVISHKECWVDPLSPSGYATIGGFPLQMTVTSQLFNETRVITTLHQTERPAGTTSLGGHCLQIQPLPAPPGQNLRRKIALLTWLPRHLAALWRTVKETDAVHALVPGDVGLIGILVALAQGKPLFVRHCGTWGEPVTAADHFLLWLLERIAGGRNVVMATGGGPMPPSAKNPAINWIHSTTLRAAEIEAITPAPPWQPGKPLRLVTVGRITPEKNAAAIIQALPILQQQYSSIFLDVVGAGPALDKLKQLTHDLNLDSFVTFHGNVAHERVLAILQAAHLFLFPTKVKEGFPKAVLEAMACGLPVVATGVSVLPHLIGNENGRLLPEPTAAAVAEAVLGLLENEEKLAAMGRSARQTSRTYTLEAWQKIIAQRLEEAWGPGVIREDYGAAG